METNEPVKINKKIVGFKVVTQAEVFLSDVTSTEDLEVAYEDLIIEKGSVVYLEQNEVISFPRKELKRPLRLDNEWRLKPPYATHALYVRLNAITHEGKKYPYEIFFNTKDVKDIKWLNALTVTISTAFRTAIETGTSLQPLIDNFKESCDTESPYLSRVPEKPKFVNGLVAEIGLVIEEFNKECLAWNYSESSHERPATTEEETAAGAYEALKELDNLDYEKAGLATTLFQVAKITNSCPDCGFQLTKQAGCDICLSCSYSKCG